MNILVVSQYFYPEQFRINDITERLVQCGHNVSVLTGLPNYPIGIIPKEYRKSKKRKEVIGGVRVERVPLIARRNGTIYLMLNYLSFMISACIRAITIKKEFDIIYVYQLSPVFIAVPALFLKKITKKPVLLYCLDAWPEAITCIGINRNSFFFRIINIVSKKIYQGCNYIQTTSQLHRNYFIDSFKIDMNKIEVVYQHEIEIEKCNNDDLIQFDNGFNVIYIGNLGKIQSVDTIIKAASKLKDLQINFHIMGTGVEIKSLILLKDQLSLNNVHFYGSVDFNFGQSAIRQADCSVMAIKKGSEIDYPFPGKVQSYLKNGCPIVAAMNNEAADFINSNKVGLCCSAEDYHSMAENIKVLYQNHELLKQFKLNSVSVFNKNFSTNIFIENLINRMSKIR